MANAGSKESRVVSAVRSPGAMIAGPRRVRATPPPLPPEARAPATEPSPLSLDYDEPTVRRPSSAPAPRASQLPPAAPRAAVPPALPPLSTPLPQIPAATKPAAAGGVPARWFVLGVVIGVLGITLVRGDGVTTLRSARLWGANAIRSMKKSGPTIPVNAAPATTKIDPPPCSLTDDDCAVLMAPFLKAEAEAAALQASIPVVDVSDLPKVKPPVVYVAPPPKPLDVSSPVAQPEEPTPAGGTPPPDAPPPPKRAPGPFDAPGPVEPRGMVATAPVAP